MLEYAFTIWSPTASTTNITKLQTIQNTDYTLQLVTHLTLTFNIEESLVKALCHILAQLRTNKSPFLLP